MRAFLLQDGGCRKDGLMDRERVLEWANDDREDRGLVQPVEIEEEDSVVAKIYVRGDRKTDELASSSTASDVVLINDDSAETLMNDISGMSGRSVSRIYIIFMTTREILPLGRSSSRSNEESAITLSSGLIMMGSPPHSLRSLSLFAGVSS